MWLTAALHKLAASMSALLGRGLHYVTRGWQEAGWGRYASPPWFRSAIDLSGGGESKA